MGKISLFISSLLLNLVFSVSPIFAQLTHDDDEDEKSPISITIQQNTSQINQQIIAYNNHYQTKIQTAAELEADMLNRLKLFSDKLRECTPGIYQYSIAGPFELLFITTQIKGTDAGLCLTETTYKMGVWGTISSVCAFQPRNLQTIADHPDLGMVTVVSSTAAFVDKDDAMKDCKTSVSGGL